MSALTNPADERRVREIVREELAAGLKSGDARVQTVVQLRELKDSLAQLVKPVDKVAVIAEECRKLLNEPSRFLCQLDVPHEGESDHAFARRVIERALDRFVGSEVVGDHIAQQDGRQPSLGDVEISPSVPHDSSPSVECGAPTVGEPAAPAGELRAQTSGAAIPYDGTPVEFVCDEDRIVSLGHDGAGGIYIKASGTEAGLARLDRDELFEFTELLADLIDCDLRIRDNDGPI